MKEDEGKNYKEIEELVKAKFYAVEMEPAEETMAVIRPTLKKKRGPNSSKAHSFSVRIAAAVASVIIFIGVGLAVWLTQLNGDGPDIPPNYRYEDGDIDLNPCEKSDIIGFPGLYVPNLDLIVMDEVYKIATHKESLETVYFVAEGVNIDLENGIARRIMLTIILQKKFGVYREEQYTSGDQTNIAGQEISVLAGEPQDSFYYYQLGFKRGDVRYYMDFQTTSPDESDVESFMLLFLI